MLKLELRRSVGELGDRVGAFVEAGGVFSMGAGDLGRSGSALKSDLHLQNKHRHCHRYH